MPDLFQCHTCPSEPNLAPVTKTNDGADCCSQCGSTNGNVVTPEQFREGMEAGAFYSKDANGQRVAYKRKQDE